MSADFIKAPLEELDYVVNWASWLSGAEVITSSSWDGELPGMIMTTPGYEASFDDTTTTVWLRDGVLGTIYWLRNTITTDGGRKAIRTITVKVEHKSPRGD